MAVIEVRFPTLSPFVLTELAQPGGARPTEGRGLLYMPEGASRQRPAVVVLEGLGGLKPVRELAYGRRLAEHGHVALVVDTFGARGAARHSHPRRALTIPEAMMLADAFAALRMLSRHPAVDPDRISVIGFSYGGMIAVLTAYEQIRRLYAPEGLRFAGHVSYYGCSVPRLDQPTATGAPVRMLLAEKDTNVSIARSRAIAADLERGGAPVELTVFEGATHQWDSDDIKPRFERFSLVDITMRLGTDDVIRDERLGFRITGPVSRTLAVAKGISLKGYYMQRDEPTFQKSEQALYGFLEQVAGSTATQRLGGRPRRRIAAAAV